MLPVTRFAPSPSGRMHLGNIFTAVMSWLSVKSRGGRWILRIEDLDPQRSKPEYTERILDDLRWLGLDCDEGPYFQSRRHDIYEEYLRRLTATGLCYPCRCTRADLMAVNAPHLSDGRRLYPGTCRPEGLTPFTDIPEGRAIRLKVPDEDIEFIDRTYGPQRVNLAHEVGDFVLRRADGAWSYQLAVTVDDALMGVNEVVRGSDLLGSSAQQIYLRRLLGLPDVEYMHVPLVCNSQGIRLSKRDASLRMEALRAQMTAPELLGRIAAMAGLRWEGTATLPELLEAYRRGPVEGSPLLTGSMCIAT